jgi:hypothetical protein
MNTKGWIVYTDSRIQTPIAQRKIWQSLYDLVLSCHPDLSFDGLRLAACDLSRANPHLYHHYAINSSVNVWRHMDPNTRHLKWTVLIEVGTPNRDAIPLLIGPNGRGIKEMRGTNDNVYCCVLATHRICVYLDCVEDNHRNLLEERALIAHQRLHYMSRRYTQIWNT